MAGTFRTFIRSVLIAINVALAIVFVLACLAPYLNPVRWWFISWLGFIFPFLLVFLMISVVFWLFFKAKYALVFLLVLLLGWKSIHVFFAFHLPKRFQEAKSADALRVVTWNVARFVEIKRNHNAGSRIRLDMMDELKKQNADILCLQEFYTAEREDYYDNIGYIRERLGYPYYYFSFDNDGDRQYFSSVIFSRLPIIDSGLVVYPQPSLPERLLHIDVKLNDDTVRIFTTHLQSVQFKKSDYDRINEIKNYDEGIVSNSRTIFSKLKRGFTYRSIQANVIAEQLKESNHHTILCGDFNDLPNSYTYFKIRGDMQDAFLKTGFGIGRTFSSISPTLRIDYILASQEFSILQSNRIIRNTSDHYMLVADLKLKSRSQ